MNTTICPTCGCSLIRLGIKKQSSESYSFEGEEYYFCCQGCKDAFLLDPRLFIEELLDLHVCPVCLAEKMSAFTVLLKHDGMEIRLCRCAHCKQEFGNDPIYYLDRLAGKTEFVGLFDGRAISCC